jgi:hypothetical protein
MSRKQEIIRGKFEVIWSLFLLYLEKYSEKERKEPWKVDEMSINKPTTSMENSLKVQAQNKLLRKSDFFGSLAAFQGSGAWSLLLRSFKNLRQKCVRFFSFSFEIKIFKYRWLCSITRSGAQPFGNLNYRRLRSV